MPYSEILPIFEHGQLMEFPILVDGAVHSSAVIVSEIAAIRPGKPPTLMLRGGNGFELHLGCSYTEATTRWLEALGDQRRYAEQQTQDAVRLLAEDNGRMMRAIMQHAVTQFAERLGSVVRPASTNITFTRPPTEDNAATDPPNQPPSPRKKRG